MAETESVSASEPGQEQEIDIKPVENLTELQTMIGRLKEDPKSRVATLLTNVNPEHLTDEEVKFYNAFALGQRDKEEFFGYQDGIFSALDQDKDNPELKSKADFSAFLQNIVERQIKKK